MEGRTICPEEHDVLRIYQDRRVCVGNFFILPAAVNRTDRGGSIWCGINRICECTDCDKKSYYVNRTYSGIFRICKRLF